MRNKNKTRRRKVLVVAEPTEEEDTLASSPLDSRVSCASAGASIDQFSLRVEALRSEQPYLEVEDLALLGCHGGEADDAGGGGDARGRRRRVGRAAGEQGCRHLKRLACFRLIEKKKLSRAGEKARSED